MPKFKKIRRLVWKALDEYQHRRSLNYLDDEDCDPTGRHDAGVKQEVFARKEMEELNNWARLGFQLYFGWFGLQFTINAVAMSWLFTYKGAVHSFGSLVLIIFTGWNLMGTIGTLLVRNGLLDCDLRIRELITLTHHQFAEGHSYRPHSPVPRRAINAVFAFCTITMLMSVVFWIILLFSQRS